MYIYQNIGNALPPNPTKSIKNNAKIFSPICAIIYLSQIIHCFS